MEVDESSSFESSTSEDGPTEWLQKVNKLEQYLPYNEELQRIRQHYLDNLKSNAFKAVLAQGDTLDQWIEALEE